MCIVVLVVYDIILSSDYDAEAENKVANLAGHSD